ncbi:hypothetical protein HJC23_005942 [Cyclotella cryptica]|uniref:Uncharacterized protein n=1 Tax=Cyclotella cryptica TaxID=29204 RepID=A0ABD3QZ53_9STRA|eukprot:CCRYP_000503-RA/>CCRYP_000503-RA protein AED:0.19 eAED:0.19 QI:109/1/1/1/0.33/0.28/7/4038/684
MTSIEADIPTATVVNVPPQPPHQHAAPPLRKYRGGFHSSICSIFSDPTRRTDCCAVACCGVLASDRTRYLLNGTRPPPLWRRLGIYLVIPALFVAAMNYFAVEVPASETEVNDDQFNEVFGEPSDQGPTKVAPFPLRLSFYAYLIVLGMYSRYQRRSTRKEIVKKLYEERASARGETVDSNQLRLFLERSRYDTWTPHRSCWCYAVDDMFFEDGVVAPVENGHDDVSEIEGDFCTRLWACLAKTFWASCCGCWCQCCSICAVAQEEREVNRLTGNEDYTMDYVTFQPYSEYYPVIQNLRDDQITSLWKHVTALSELSVKLLKSLVAVLAVLCLFSLSNINENFSWRNMIVLLLTFGQAFFIEYLVHWRWCKFDLSFDSVVKYFACGFLLTTPMAIVFEAIISTLASLLTIFVVVMVVGTDDSIAKDLEVDPKQAMKDFAMKYQGIFIAYVFVNSFVVAAVVEEMVKYFGYWMVVVPDLLPDSRSASGSIATSYNSNGNEDEVSRPMKSARSTGAGITVAMVSVALGFACCENLMYIFVYSPPSLGVEITTLIARSLFPVHPLCAAIQSIGVCKRDIEGNKNYGLGRVISPAVLLHGSFDFVLMLAAFYGALKKVEEGDNENESGEGTSSDASNEEDFASELPSLISGLVFVILGCIYYTCASRSQNQRLIAMDNAARDQSSLLV